MVGADKNQKETMSADNDRMTSMGLSKAAGEYLNAAGILEREKRPQLFSPTLLCACQALELGLKAFLRGSGYAKDDLWAVGHDLVAAVHAAKARGLDKLVTLSVEETETIHHANRYFRFKDLQYPEAGLKTQIPKASTVIAVAERIINGTRSFCIEQRKAHFGRTSAVKWEADSNQGD